MLNWISKISDGARRGREWLLAREKELFVVLLILLSSSLSYGLGRLSKIEENRPPVTITAAEEGAASAGQNDSDSIQAASQPKVAVASEKVVASKNGTKYYHPWCSGAKRIKPENLVSFASEAAAQTAGYEKASNCPELK